MQSGRHLARGVEPGQRRGAGLGLHPQPAHRIVNGRRHLHGLPGDVDVRQPKELLVHGRQFLLDLLGTQMGDVEKRAAMLGAATGFDLVVDRSRDDVTRR